MNQDYYQNTVKINKNWRSHVKMKFDYIEIDILVEGTILITFQMISRSASMGIKLERKPGHNVVLNFEKF